MWPSTARILRDWLRENTGSMAFPGVRGEPLSRFAVRLLLQKAFATASSSCSSLRKKRISPHTIRHGTAMALLDAGVDISVIALWLGHESIETTNGYLHTSIALKEKALAKVTPSGSRSSASTPTTACSRSSHRSDYVQSERRSPASRLHSSAPLHIIRRFTQYWLC